MELAISKSARSMTSHHRPPNPKCQGSKPHVENCLSFITYTSLWVDIFRNIPRHICLGICQIDFVSSRFDIYIPVFRS